MSTSPRLLVVVLVLSGSVSMGAQAPVVPGPSLAIDQILEDARAIQNFQRSVAEYVVLHQQLEREVPPLVVTPDVEEISMAVRALAMRIGIARGTARQGDIITPEVAQMFRRRIASCLTPEGWKAVFADRERDEEGPPIGPPPLRVNMEWPAGLPFDSVPPQLLRSLPALPQELQYRIIGRSLVLWDHHANLIADFLPGAFAPMT